ncbi:MAG: ATP-dependent DNA helicase RecG [Myxococcales bacterium FL481]|nr:MAG: ATP-dependent DNA helicase RecG [Myxococcales bacterium FL481]
MELTSAERTSADRVGIATSVAPAAAEESRRAAGEVVPPSRAPSRSGPSARARRLEGAANAGPTAQLAAAANPGSGPDARDEPLTVLPRVGDKTAAKLATRGLHTVEDVACFLPRAYRDLRRRERFEDAAEGDEVVGVAVIRDYRSGWARGRFHAKMIVQQDHEGASPLELRWFHPVGGLAQRVATGRRILVVGVIKSYRGQRNMVHPELYDPDDDDVGIRVVYPAVEGVGAATMARLCQAALARLVAAGHADTLPVAVRNRRNLPTRIDALDGLHAPPPDIAAPEISALATASSRSHRRLAFEELFLLQLALLRRRAGYRRHAGSIPGLAGVDDGAEDEALRVCLPFEPTGAQWRVIREIRADLVADQPMLRLLQGDVGSGKTAVAFAAALALARAGSQTAMMAPTEILAEQHLRTLGPWCEAAKLKVALLTGNTPRAQRASLLALLGAGKIDVLVGTHALLVDDVVFASLGLVVVDEQHRFGVEQRDGLRRKAMSPHLLVMTATPIPRSLALTAFGELDTSVIDELPPGRQPCATHVFAGKGSLDRARRGLCKLVGRGARVYVVCPLVEASEAIDVTDVEAAAAEFRQRMPGRQVGVVHGRMHPTDKERVLAAFRGGELSVLVATTVIEVGVDVPDATAILVEHAERFGLAQLHQLRGRVGRGAAASYCLLHTASEPDSESGQRLAVLAEHTDGFTVAERDLELRGPGEVFGTQQSGMPRLRFARFTSGGLALLEQAREDAQALLGEDPTLRQHPLVAQALARELDRRDVFAGESG